MYKLLDSIYSKIAKNMRRSEIRELLKLTSKPGIISFAGGLPASDTFPVKKIAEITNLVMEREGEKALQYGPTEGSPVLRETLSKLMTKKEGYEIPPENIIVVTASQQALEIISKVYLDFDADILVGRPTYVGAISAFRAYGANMIGVTLDNEGMRMDKLERELKRLRKISNRKRPRFIYTIPDFQNPAGITMTQKRRQELLELAYEYETLVIEDSPYRELRYEGEAPDSLLKMDKDKGFVVSLHTFSKIFAPGMRIGWIVADKQVLDKFIIAKQSMDLCSNEFSQRIIAEYLNQDLLAPNIESTIGKYNKKREVMLKALDDHFSDIEGVSWTKPEGGLFLWLTLPESINDDAKEKALFNKAVENNVAYVIGSAFYGDQPKYNAMRINFSYPSEEQIQEGIEELSKVVKDFLAQDNNYVSVASP